MGFDLTEIQKSAVIAALAKAESVTARYGLTLTPGEMQAVAEARVSALSDTGRLEVGRSVVGDIVYAFCDSPYAERDSWAETLCALIESFFYFKNESDDVIPDEDLIALMRERFDGACGGSCEAMQSMDITDLVRGSRYGHPEDDSELKLF